MKKDNFNLMIDSGRYIKLGKLRQQRGKVWAFGSFLSAAFTPLPLLMTPGPSAFMPMLVFALVMGFIETASFVAPSAVFGDIIDYDTLKTGSNKASSYYAASGLILKSIIGVGSALGLFLLSSFNFNIQGGNTPDQNIGLFLAFGFVPAITYAVSGLIIMNFPIDEHLSIPLSTTYKYVDSADRIC